MSAFATTAAYPAIEATYSFSEYAIQLPELDAAQLTFIRLIENVHSDIYEMERLLSLPCIHSSLENSPMKRTWVRNGIHNIKSALNDVGLFIERMPLAKDGDTGTIFASRVRLVLQNFRKFENQQSELATCHQTLTAILNLLSPLEFLTGKIALDPPSKVSPSAGEAHVTLATSQEPYEASSPLGDVGKLTTYNEHLLMSSGDYDSVSNNQRRPCASNIASPENLQAQLPASLEAEAPRPLFSHPLPNFHSQNGCSRLPNNLTQSNVFTHEELRPGPQIPTIPPRLSIVTREQIATTQNESLEQTFDQRRESLVSPLILATGSSLMTPEDEFLTMRHSRERTQSEISWKDSLNCTPREATSYSPIFSNQANSRIPDYFKTYRRSSSPGSPYVPVGMKSGTPPARNIYPPRAMPSVIPRPRSSNSPAREVQERAAIAVGVPQHLQYNNRPRSTTETSWQNPKTRFDMPLHTQFLGRPHSTAPRGAPPVQKLAMPHPSQFITSPTSDKAIHMPHHRSYTRPQSMGPPPRYEERSNVPYQNPSYVSRPQAPYPTSPGISLAHLSSMGTGDLRPPQNFVVQNRRPQSMITPAREGFQR